MASRRANGQHNLNSISLTILGHFYTLAFVREIAGGGGGSSGGVYVLVDGTVMAGA